ncbi:MAG: type II secretion system minor pseudopilin GspJ [Pseudomonadota bacterium]|nr:type II secretion system minor pseudopilin GspJ [Pseudomonadota bacterium]
MTVIKQSRPRSQGFTLLELLVAIAIFAIMAALGGISLEAVVTQQAIANENYRQLKSLQRSVQILCDDLYQLQPRGVRDVLGQNYELPLIADGRGLYLLRLSRAGWRNPAGFSRGTLQRVQYRLNDGALIREYWPVLDPVLAMEPIEEVLLENVALVKFEFLDIENAQPEWEPVWPPLRIDASDWPKAVRFAIEIDGFGRIERLIEVPG